MPRGDMHALPDALRGLFDHIAIYKLAHNAQPWRGAPSQLRVWPDASEISRQGIVLGLYAINAKVLDILLRLR